MVSLKLHSILELTEDDAYYTDNGEYICAMVVISNGYIKKTDVMKFENDKGEYVTEILGFTDPLGDETGRFAYLFYEQIGTNDELKPVKVGLVIKNPIGNTPRIDKANLSII